MNTRRPLLALLLAAAAAPHASAGASALDLVPENAAAAIAVRNLNDLRRKGDKLLAAADVPDQVRPSKLFEELYKFQGIADAVDPDGSAAIVVADPKTLGIELFSAEGEPNFRGLGLLVVVVPFTDRDRIAACFGIAKGALKPDTMVSGKAKGFGSSFYAHGNHVYCGIDEKAVLSVAKDGRVGASLPRERRRLLEEADGFFRFRRGAIDPIWQRYLKDQAERVGKAGDDRQRETARRLFATLGAVHDAWLVLRVDEGLGLSFVATFLPGGKGAARDFLTELGGGPGAADLAGLPAGKVLTAQAFRGDGRVNAGLARFLADWSLSDFAAAEKWLAAAERPAVLGFLTEVWKRLRGSRLAVYHNADPAAHGEFAVAAVLDTDDGAAFLAEVRQLARYSSGGVDLSDRAGRGGDREAVRRLVADLAEERFAVRESAATKLVLIGEGALPFLAEGERSGDPELKRRSGEVRGRIAAAAKAAREALVSGDAGRRLRPTFRFDPKPETLDGRRVEVLHLKLDARDAASAAPMRRLLGPDWEKVRIVPRGKQVAVLVGSDAGLLRETLKNLDAGAPGLAAAGAVAARAGSRDPARKMEVYVSLAAALGLLGDDRQPRAKAPAKQQPLSAFALTVDPEYLRVDAWTPPADMKALREAGQRR